MLRRLLPVVGPMLVLALGVPLLAASPAVAGLETSEDQTIADESVLVLSEVPASFEIFTDDEDDEPQRGSKCKAVNRASKQLNAAPHNEASFNQGNDALINNQVSVFETVKAAKAAYVPYAAENAEGCFAQGFKAGYEARLSETGEVDVTVDPYEPDLGEASAGYEIQIDLRDKGDQQTLFVNLEVVRVGRAINAFAFLNSGEPLSSDDIVAMTETGVTRLEAAL